MKKLFAGMFLASVFMFGPLEPVSAITFRELWTTAKDDVIAESKLALLEQSQIGWGWDLKKDDNGGPTALLDIYQYRFVIASFGWSNPSANNIPIIVAGFHIDKLVRQIAPRSADKVRDVIGNAFSGALLPVWDILTVSYGPGWDLDKQPKHAITHFVTINFQFGGQ
jgi:hypothetical protein